MKRILALAHATLLVAAAPIQSSGTSEAKQSVASTAQPRPAAQFAELPTLKGPRISPDGKLIAAQVASNGKQYLAIIPLGGGSPRFVATGENDLNWWNWVNNEWLVVGIGANRPMSAYHMAAGEWYVRRAVGVNAAGDRVVPLAVRDAQQVADNVIWTAHDGSPRILLAVQKSTAPDELGFWPEVLEVDVSSGRTRLALAPREGVLRWTADSDGVVRMGVGQSLDGREMRVLYRNGEGDAFREIVRPTRDRDSVVIPTLIRPGSTKALAFIDDEKGYRGLYEYDVATLSPGKQLYGSKGFDLVSFMPNASADSVDGVQYLEDRPRREWIDPDLQKLQAEVAATVKGGDATLLDYSADHKRALVRVGAANSPGAIYLYDRSSGGMHQLAYINPQIRMARLNPVKTIRFKARDGLEIAAVLTLPRLRPANQLPLIVLPHGGPYARDAEEWDWWTQYLAEHGYAVVQPNYRGSSGYGTAFAKKGEGQWGLAMQDDLIDAVGYLAKEGVIDPKRVCIVGASYGGYAAMRAAQRDAATYRCAVSYAGVSSLDRMRRYDRSFMSSGVRMDWLRLQATDFRSVSPLTTPEKSEIPLLLVHGRKDNVVPVNQSRELADRLRGAGKSVTYIEQPLADHYFTQAGDRLQFLEALQAFLDKYNPA